ncbi:MAG TPA: site-2 protease family protein [Acidimicrobiia bacterium]|nr:site-2 protease family protein [Acidimicrobiia bacterium]
MGWLVLDGMGLGATGVIDTVGWISMLFGSVLIHEVAHALVGRFRGAEVQGIILFPIGGATRLMGLPESSGSNLAMTAAGPLTSLALAAASGLVALAARVPLLPVDLHHGTIMGRLFWLNLILALFNLLPLFPMDGGRILQALLSRRLGDRRATTMAARVGQVLAAGLVGFGLTGNLWLAVIGIYLFVVAGTEARAAATLPIPIIAPDDHPPVPLQKGAP